MQAIRRVPLSRARVLSSKVKVNPLLLSSSLSRLCVPISYSPTQLCASYLKVNNAIEYRFYSTGTNNIMQERIAKHGFKEVVVKPNNCQMRALADQLFGNEEKHAEVRAEIAKWLSKNEKFVISEGTVLGDFLDRDEFPNWKDYVDYIASDGNWGDHLSLLAAAEAYKVSISVLSNVTAKGNYNYINTIDPKSAPTKTVYLANYQDQHFNSLKKI